ncbi:hypothetical protein DICPUDRAFT_149119 [Dictyostelium purpureum]|uniref:PPPDE domain-containing protein n=1 Tax=Dictyostelium purpureum TaxID=5786 RepID=F0ZCW5_DICPU|nr:uncharacterized protein DICPUDRAFT_149119 [Dictyostelium purpureum]EGC38232.1 hypothetical protein DICPUDRAFT_149119 [Dictyostelium purpureum]|eukprot:XP_003285270.1 hypothetical protein DICPUDRAFT_149119 [Dictyostelium purpureum]
MHQIKLHVYDLSRGMAKSMSLGLTGKQIDAIYHTSIVCYGTEYYFGGGILRDKPFCTPHGTPQEIIDLGETEVDQDLFENFLSGITDRFRMDTYHLLENNCNHFTNECSNFLLGKGIPDHIVNLPSDFLKTPLGAMLGPMINNFFGGTGTNSWSNRVGPVNSNAQPPSLLNGFNNNNNYNSLPSNITSNTTNTITTSATTSNPTLHPKTIQNHKHTKISIPLILNYKPVLFEKSDVDAVFIKLASFANEEFKGISEKIKEFEINSPKLQQIIKSTNENIIVPIELCKYLEQLLKSFSEPHQFPLLEILRMLLLKDQPNKYFTDLSNETISNLMKSILKKKLSKASELLSYRVINNCFSSKSGIAYLFSDNNINDTFECVIDGLHSKDKILKRAVSTIAYNCSIYLTSNYNEQNLSLLTAVSHVLSEIDLSTEDPEIVFRLLMTVGTLVYCNDESLDILSTLEFDYNKYLKSPEDKIKKLIKEIQLLN